jgi:hypothetical protein
MGEIAEKPFWQRPLDSLSRDEWEALCDGCGKCCLNKLEDEDTGEYYFTNVACKLLDLETARCSNYRGRLAYVPDCVRLTVRSVLTLPWLPETCAYKLRAAGKPLPGWHYLVSGDRETIHREGMSVAGKAISEVEVGNLEDHIIWPHRGDDGDA